MIDNLSKNIVFLYKAKSVLYGKRESIAKSAGVNRQTVDAQMNEPQKTFNPNIWEAVINELLLKNDDREFINRTFDYWFRRTGEQHERDKRELQELPDYIPIIMT